LREISQERRRFPQTEGQIERRKAPSDQNPENQLGLYLSVSNEMHEHRQEPHQFFQ
jgi:hypothetical protein